MRRLARYFFQGLIVLVPIAVTAYVFWAAFRAVDSWLGLSVPGLGVVVVILGITLAGLLANLFLVAPLVRLVERLIEGLPFVKLLYGAVRDLLSAVVGEEKRFDRPVLVEMADGVAIIGFVTRDDLSGIGITDRVAVYLPQSYNFAGQTLVVGREKITPIDATGGDAMTFVVSAGVAGKRDALREAPAGDHE